MKKLFIYYSNGGNGDAVASYLSENGVETRKIAPVKELPKSFFLKMMAGGFLASIKHKSKLDGFDADISGYDGIIIGSPIWNGRISCPVNAALDRLDLSGKDLSFIFYAGGGEAPKAEERVRKEYPNASVRVLKEPKKYPEELSKIEL